MRIDEQTVIKKGVAAFYRHAEREGYVAWEPSRGASYVNPRRREVVLLNVRGGMAIPFRIARNGVLRFNTRSARRVEA